MEQPIGKLTLIYPPQAEDSLIELMLEQEPAIAGFTTLRAEGHGFGFEQAASSEKVRGRIDRRMMILVMPVTRFDDILDRISQALPIPNLIYWTENVQSAGRLS